LYFIISIIHILADTTCKIPEDGVRTSKHVGAILILIYTTYKCICLYINKH